ncbi:hypothetical protein EDB92DRAFT_1820135 [Lactarius akahatsu]|uniref:Uncharacterized protein n=1 Tax=Lactarius akahatsu TaxID=416441 RepID=A0AAD4L8Q9_9AGAM|nr:hypothetical protein EDB92DRAFT_1820135 [Lactarius akahatsu]
MQPQQDYVPMQATSDDGEAVRQYQGDTVAMTTVGYAATTLVEMAAGQCGDNGSMGNGDGSDRTVQQHDNGMDDDDGTDDDDRMDDNDGTVQQQQQRRPLSGTAGTQLHPEICLVFKDT